jgi:hypothetical protein
MDRRSFLKNTALGVPATTLLAQTWQNPSQRSNLPWSKLPYPFGPPVFPPFEKVEARLQQWAQENPRVFALNVPGKSVQGRAVYAARITDPDTPEEDKERVLLTALHAGQEHGGATAVLHIMQWLVSGDPLVREILRRQVIIAMPVVDPDSYINWLTTSGLANSLGQDPYSMWSVDGPLHPDRCPEAVAVRQVMDQFQAEVHSDIHTANSLPFPGSYASEESGRAYSNPSLRPYHHEIYLMMDQAALEEGYPSDQLESDAERVFGSAEMGITPEKLWNGYRTSGHAKAGPAAKQRLYAALYEYNRYHTMVLASESSWDRSAWLRHRRMLQVGNEIFPGEYYPGYPVRVIMKNSLPMVVAYGQTAAERRRSRVELWNKQRQIAHGFNNPYVVGRLIYVCATSPAAKARWLPDVTLKGFAARMKEHPKMHAQRIQEIVQGFPEIPGQWGPSSMFIMQGGDATPEQSSPIEYGLSMRLRIPFPQTRNIDLWMNGERVPVSEHDGYISWVGRGFANIQINVPPEKSRTEDLYVVTCRWDPGEERTVGLDWS